MRLVKIESGKDKGKSVLTMNEEPKFRQLKKSEMITTHNISEAQARRKAEAEAEAAKAEEERKRHENEK